MRAGGDICFSLHSQRVQESLEREVSRSVSCAAAIKPDVALLCQTSVSCTSQLMRSSLDGT